MIYNIQTFCIYGYWPDTDLKPRSNKPIIVGCDKCGKIRITTKNSYHALCKSCGIKKRFENPEERDKIRRGMIKLYEDSEEREKQRRSQKKRYEDPKERKKITEGVKKSYKNDPTRSQKHSELMKTHYAKMDDPGQDIVRHHYIYDHNDLSLYTMKMTRGQHSRLHHILRRAKIKIPHINIEEV